MDQPSLLDSPAPAGLVDTRIGLHRLAAYVIAPLRHAATGRFGLRVQPGGWGTRSFDGRVVRVHGADLIDQHRNEIRSAPITSLAAAADFLGTEVDPETAAEHDSPEVGDIDADLGVDEVASNFIAEWFALAFEALGVLAGESSDMEPSEAQLWPGHFDAAIELGDEAHRATFGASAGDHAIPEPYLYVSVWWPDKIDLDTNDPYWNAESFVGSTLRYSELPATPRLEAALDFWRAARDMLR